MRGSSLDEVQEKDKAEDGSDDGEKKIEINAQMQGSLSFKDPVNLKINGNFILLFRLIQIHQMKLSSNWKTILYFC